MKITQLSTHIYVAGQITADDLNIVVTQGIRSVINNRPDNEAEGQPKSDDLATAAADLGLEFVHIPVTAKSITDRDVDDLIHALSVLQGPILLFCRSGARSTLLWNFTVSR